MVIKTHILQNEGTCSGIRARKMGLYRGWWSNYLIIRDVYLELAEYELAAVDTELRN